MNVLRLAIPPLPRFARTARRAFADFAGFHHLGERDADSLIFALGEAVANAIQHAATRRSIDIRVRVAGDSVVVTVSDRGCGFADPPADRVMLPSAYAEAGRGFAIMQRFTDFLEVDTKPGRGTIVTFGRHRRDREEHAAAS
ncbi:MAG TPA: ATP-binding protein [Candidatus Babeliales bacterium]|nr:ATP-binding protein [Candidatus Babeliales bacterium]